MSPSGHEYLHHILDEINYIESAWDVAKNKLPELKRKINRIISNED